MADASSTEKMKIPSVPTSVDPSIRIWLQYVKNAIEQLQQQVTDIQKRLG